MSKNLRHFIFSILTIIAVSLLVNNGFAQNRFWVNGEGTWNDINHWSETSGGSPGASIPTKLNNVVFDNNSFTSNNQIVLIKKSVVCKNFIWYVENVKPTIESKSFLFKSNTKAELQVFGSLNINENVDNEFYGDIVLRSSEESVISIEAKLNSDLFINAKGGQYKLEKDLITEGDISLNSGTFITNDKNIDVNNFIGSGAEQRELNLGNSEISTNIWDFQKEENLSFDAGGSQLLFKKGYANEAFKPGNLEYNKFTKVGAKSAFGFSLTPTPVTCNGAEDGGIVVDITSGGTSPFTFVLYEYIAGAYSLLESSGAVASTSYTFDPIKYSPGLPGGKYLVDITDNEGTSDGGIVVVSEPDILSAGAITVETPLSCFDGNDAALEVSPIGGTEPYAYQWLKYNNGTAEWDTLVGETNKITTGVDQGLYRVFVNDVNDCGPDYTQYVFKRPPRGDSEIPAEIIFDSYSSTSSCDGSDIGTISISASGGVGIVGYYLIRTSDLLRIPAGLNATGNFTGLQADTYETWAVDANGCEKQGNDVVIISVASPTASIIPDPANACPGVALTLNGNPTQGDGTSFVNHEWTGADIGSLNNTGIQSPDFTNAIIGTYNLTYTVTDNNGCTGSDNISIEVGDTENPDAACKDIIVQLDGTGNISIVGSDVDNGSSDNCTTPGNLLFTVSPNSFNCTNIGDNLVTLTVTDELGNSDICTATVTVEEHVVPVAVCKDITVQLDATGNVSIVAADVNNGSSDNCTLPGDLVLSVSPNTFTCANIGANTVTLTVTDQGGNSSTCTATVTVEDNIAPTIACKDITVQLDATGNVSITPADVSNGSGDNCSDFTLSLDQTDFTCADIGVNVVTLTIDDGHGQTDNCTANVTVEDNIAPTAVCQNITVQLDGTGNVSIVPADVDNGSSDNCSDFTLSLDQTDFTCADVGDNTVTLTINDGHGQTDNCTATVTVEEHEAPVAVCKDITVQLDATGNVSIVAADVDNGSSDNCTLPGDLVLSVSPNTFTCANIGANTVTLTVTDQGGNSSTCNATVTVEDNIAPTIACQDITVQLDATGNVSITPADVDNGSGDNCSDFTLSLDQTDFTCADIGVNVVTLTIDDGHGQTDNCTANVTVEDNIAPTAVCQNITVQLDGTGNVSIVPADVDNGSSDNCSDFTLSLDQTDFTCADVGDNTVTLTINDGHGQTDNCTATVTVEDNVAPIAVCQDITIQLDATGNVSILGTDVDNGSTDNCTLPGALVYSVSPNSFTCANIGANTVTLTVTDPGGNSATCNATVTVVDNIGPTIACRDITVQLDATGNVSITPADVDNGSGDNCSDFTLSLDRTDFTCADIGVNVVTLTIDDGHGQTDNCTANVTVVDNIVPTITCPADVLIVEGGSCTAVVNGIAPITDDNCAVTLQTWELTGATVRSSAAIGINDASGESFEIGTTTVTYHIEDISGNSVECSFDVEVYDEVNGGLIDADQTVCYNTSPNPFTDEQSASVCGGFTYQWEKKTGSGAWEDISGAINSTYIEITPLTEVTYYTRKAISTLGFGTANSDTITMQIQPNPIANAGADTTLCFGSVYQILDADTTNSSAVSWEILTGNGVFNSINIIDPEYTPGILDEGTIVELVLHATGEVPCGESTDTLRLNYLSELFVAIGKPTPFFIDSTATHIDVYVDITGHDYVDDVGVYLVSPLDSVVELKPACFPVIPSGFLADAVYRFYNDPIDTSAVGVIDACNGVSGRYGFSGEWKKKLHGQDPANGAWRVRIIDYENWGAPGSFNEATITFSDTNYLGVYESILYADSAINKPIVRKNLITGPGVTDHTLPITGLTTSCFGACDATAVATASGGLAPYVLYEWSNSLDFSTPFATGDTVDLCAGTFYVRATDSQGCTVIDSILVGQPPEIIITNRTIVQNDCNGDSIGEVTLEFSGGTGVLSYTHDQSLGAPKNSGETFDVLQAGTYVFTIFDISGCSIDTTIIITEPTIISSVTTVTDITCYNAADGIIDIAASGGTPAVIAPAYQYSIDSTDNWSMGNVFNSLDEGKYVVAVQDSLGCIHFGDTIYMNNPDTITIDSIKTVPTTCLGGGVDGQIIVFASGGGSTLEYSLDGINYQLNDTFPGLSICDTTVFVRDMCETVALDTLVSVTGPIPLIIDSISVVDVFTCNGDNSGQITVYASGGTGVYEYYIDGVVNSPADSAVFTGLTAGTYVLSVQDNGGCVSDDSIRIIDEPTELIITDFTIINASPCNPDSTGIVTVIASGGTGILTYSIDTVLPFQSSATFNGITLGTHTFKVQDANSCLAARDTTIILLEPLTVSFDSTNISCNGYATGEVTVIPVDGLTPYSYLWETGEITPTISGLSAGFYSVTVTDSNQPFNCVMVDSVEIIEPEAFSITADIRDKHCVSTGASSRNLANSLGRIIVDVTGGTPDYSYTWIGPYGALTDNDTIINLQPGSYSLTLTDSEGCFVNYDTIVRPDNSYDILEFNVSFEDKSVCWNEDVRFTSTYSGNVDTIFIQEVNLSTFVATNWEFEVFNENPYTASYHIDDNTNFERIIATNEFCKADTSNIRVDYFPDFQLDIVPEFDDKSLEDTIVLKFASSGQLGAIVADYIDISSLTFAWTPQEFLTAFNEQFTTVRPDESGWYKVIVSSTDECIDSSDVYLEFIPSINPYTGFSPNGDGVNDYWRIKHIEKFPNNIVTIFNRWGVKIYEQKGYVNDDTSKSWNGTKNGKDLSSGTYYYVIILNEPGADPISGPITILR